MKRRMRVQFDHNKTVVSHDFEEVPVRTRVIVSLITAVTLIAIACSPGNGGQDTATDPTATAQAARVFEGEVRFKDVASSFDDATVYVRLQSKNEGTASTEPVAEQVIHKVSVDSANPGRVAYSLQYPELRAGTKYEINIHVDVDGSGDVGVGDFINKTDYPVTASGRNPFLRITVEAVGVEKPQTAAMVRVKAQIEDIKLNVTDSDPPEFSLEITSRIPGGCVKSNGYNFARNRYNMFALLFNLEPADPNTPCTKILGRHEATIDLGTKFRHDRTYVVQIHDEAYVFNGGAKATLSPVSPDPLKSRTVRGEVFFQGISEPLKNATVRVLLLDTAWEELPPQLIGERKMPGVTMDPSKQSGVKYSFQVPGELNVFRTYELAVHVDADNSGSFNGGDYQSVLVHPIPPEHNIAPINVTAHPVKEGELPRWELPQLDELTAELERQEERHEEHEEHEEHNH